MKHSVSYVLDCRFAKEGAAPFKPLASNLVGVSESVCNLGSKESTSGKKAGSILGHSNSFQEPLLESM